MTQLRERRQQPEKALVFACVQTARAFGNKHPASTEPLNERHSWEKRGRDSPARSAEMLGALLNCLRITGLFEKFFERSLRDEANDKAPSVFNDFFVAAASPAFGANHDVLGDWL